MLALDSLVTDLMFNKGAVLDPDTLIEALGGEEVAGTRKILDPDMQDPRFEMELSPSIPFRQRGQRRLMIIDDSVAPMRDDPRSDLVVPVDLRAEKERLIALCQALDVRLGRLFALGSWGDAVLVARSARDLRGVALLHWVLDPSLDVDGHQRAGRLSTAELEAKVEAYEKRLDELDEGQIIACIHGARFERRGELLIVDVLEDDGTWDLSRSFALEHSLAALDKFSVFPGAPSGGRADRADRAGAARPGAARPGADSSRAAAPAARPAAAAAPAPAPTAARVEDQSPAAPLVAGEVAGRVVLVFPAERFDLDVAAALGKRDWDAVMHRSDPIAGALRDLVYRDGAEFVAPLEFLSEVFVDGKPLSRPQFEAGAAALSDGVRGMDVHCPRFGPVMLLDVAGRGRYITSLRSDPARVLALL